jgi:KDO2-lipid IV(A) lauroyltransferase
MALASSPAATVKPSGAPTSAWYTHGLNRAPFYTAVGAISRALPRRTRLGLASVVGAMAPLAFPAERKAIDANLARVVPHAAPASRQRLARDVFRQFAMCFSDLLSTNRGDVTPWLDAVHGAKYLDEALAEGRGVIVLTAHFGNWELAGRLMAQHCRRPTHLLVAAESDPRVERLLRDGPAPVRFIRRDEPTSALALVGALRRGEVIALQGDRALGDRSDARVRFFGAEASFPLGPFVLARATGAPIVPSFCILGDDRRYTITLGEPIRVGAGQEREALERWVAALEHAVGGRPDQWFNFFDVWCDAARA